MFYIFFFFFIRNFNLNIHVPYIFSFHITKLIFFFCSEKQTHTYTKIGDTFFDLTNFTLMVNVNISESKKKTTTKIHVHDRDYHCHREDFFLRNDNLVSDANLSEKKCEKFNHKINE